MFDQFLAATTNELYLQTYRARVPGTETIHKLRPAGRSDVTAPDAQRWFRGISIQLGSESRHEHAFEQCEFAKTMFRLSTDPLCAIDTAYEHVYMTNEPFRQLNIALPNSRSLSEMVHHHDLPTIQKFLTTIVARQT